MKKAVSTKNAPAAIGPYSQAVETGNLVFTSGMIAIDPETNEFKDGTAAEQAELAIQNLKSVLEAAGSSLGNVVKTDVFISDMNEFGNINKVYAKYFPEPFPARSCVQVACLPNNAKVEIEAVAEKQ